ncbi:MAG TPA: hypothetical protein VGE07_14660 [Herpetosiphonaceae bacterium]
MSRLMVLFWQFVAWLKVRRRVAAQGLVEYGLILVLIMVVVVGVLSVVGTNLSSRMDNIQCKTTAAGSVGMNCP